ncbi:hypothetical protein [Corynebacterium glucuronolyticum]|uniref:hypothetical protein n=1 Tax=Corynebacterium glucuronolyticum TaxID=39791 RepID=UPI001EF1B321|nr:hypothetical protein [Corynebacterium glucuronolyticum]
MCDGVVVGAGATVPVSSVGATFMVGVGAGPAVTVTVSVTVTVGCGSVDVGAGSSVGGRGRTFRDGHGVRRLLFWLLDVRLLLRIPQSCGKHVRLLEEGERPVRVAASTGSVGLLESGGKLNHSGVVAEERLVGRPQGVARLRVEDGATDPGDDKGGGGGTDETGTDKPTPVGGTLLLAGGEEQRGGRNVAPHFVDKPSKVRRKIVIGGNLALRQCRQESIGGEKIITHLQSHLHSRTSAAW